MTWRWSWQKIEHYEITNYGPLRTLAETCGMDEVARLLAQTLEEEKATDRKLDQLVGHLSPVHSPITLIYHAVLATEWPIS